MRILIKPLSVNEATNAFCIKCRSAKSVKRTQTKKYKAFQKELLLKMPPLKIDFKARLSVVLKIGVSSAGFDIDNAVKPTLDVLQKKTGINDNRIYKLYVEKILVKKGDEFLDLSVTEL